MINFERKYIRKLLEELEDAHEVIESTEQEIENVSNENVELVEEVRELELKTAEYEKTIQHLKTDIRKPAVINPQTFDIFKGIKDGGIIRFIEPSVNKKYSNYDTNPFVFELENKKAFFDGKLLGLCEIKKGNLYWYHVSDIRKPINSEIFKMIGVDRNYKNECRIKPLNSRGKFARSIKLNDILRGNPVVNIENGKFVTTGKTQYIYTKNDGTQYIVLEDGSEEVV